MTTFERESVEFQAVNVTVDGVVVTDGVTLCIAPQAERPATFTAPATIGNQIGVMIQNLQPGGYNIWARITSNPETPTIRCGHITIV